jgi:hypothetical protein
MGIVKNSTSCAVYTISTGTMHMTYDLLADTVVAIHLSYVCYVILGQAAILLGLMLKWSWIRNPYFRLSHLAAILIVAGESLLEVPCPLTVWEDHLRSLAGHPVEQGSFIGRLLDDVMFYDLEPSLFTWIYVGFAVLVVLTLVLAPPRWQQEKIDTPSAGPHVRQLSPQG